MYDKILAVFSMGLFALFMLIIYLWVESAPGLFGAMAITLAMGCYDFWREVFSSRKKENSTDSLL